MPTLYVREVDEDIHAGIRDIAFLADLSMAEVVKALAAQALGIANPHCGLVKTAAQTWRRARREADNVTA